MPCRENLIGRSKDPVFPQTTIGGKGKKWNDGKKPGSNASQGIYHEV